MFEAATCYMERNDMEKNKLLVVIPVYHPVLKAYEKAALEHNLSLMEGFSVVFLQPNNVDMSPLNAQYPNVGVIEVSGDWLGTAYGIQGYNRMMMSESFYKLFQDYTYIFICHVDAWLFKNELAAWCDRDFDLVAAPWPTRPRYTRFPLKQYLKLRLLLKPKNKIIHSQMFGRIGNGGLCLRKVKTFREACVQYADEIEYYNSQPDALHNEDLFWALVPPLKVPSVKEALTFSFDLKPELCYQLNGNRLPMACHGFNKPVRVGFWKQFIPALNG